MCRTLSLMGGFDNEDDDDEEEEEEEEEDIIGKVLILVTQYNQ